MMSATDNSYNNQVPQRRGQLKLLAIIAVVVGPMLAAWVMVKLDIGIPDSQTNRTPLVEPAMSLGDWGIGLEPVGYGAPWRLLVTVNGDCDSACLELVHTARQIHVALGRESGRAQHVLALSGELEPAVAARLDEFPRLAQTRLDAAAYQDSLHQQPEHWRQGAQLWLVDPLGTVVLHHEQGEPAKRLLDDLKYLMKVSKVG